MKQTTICDCELDIGQFDCTKSLEKKTLTPDEIIKLIFREFKLDITIHTKKPEYTDLKSMYFYLVQKYCDYHTLESIGEKVNRKHSNVQVMTKRFLERINTNGYTQLTENYKHMCYIIETEYLNTPQVQLELRIQDYEYAKLKNLYKRSLKTIKQLENKLY